MRKILSEQEFQRNKVGFAIEKSQNVFDIEQEEEPIMLKKKTAVFANSEPNKGSVFNDFAA